MRSIACRLSKRCRITDVSPLPAVPWLPSTEAQHDRPTKINLDCVRRRVYRDLADPDLDRRVSRVELVFLAGVLRHGRSFRRRFHEPEVKTGAPAFCRRKKMPPAPRPAGGSLPGRHPERIRF